MNRSTVFLSLSAVLLLLTAVSESGAEEQPVAESSTRSPDEAGVDGLLVLRNGNLLQGTIAKEADQYRVKSERSEMLIPVEQVEMLCRDIDEVYQRRREDRTGSSADSHIELANWCLRKGLLEYAARELLDVRAIDADHRQLASTERQLQALLKRRESVHQKKTGSSPADTPNEEELRELEKVPLWAKKLFVRQIQPLMIDSCATSGCHHVDSNEEFQLNRLALEGAGHPATTSRNLMAIIKQLDWKNPKESALLVHARQAHGNQGTLPPAALEQRKYHMLQMWVEQLAIAKRNAPVDEIELVQFEEEGAVDALPLIREAIQEAAKPVADPFDPAAFNERNGPE